MRQNFAESKRIEPLSFHGGGKSINHFQLTSTKRFITHDIGKKSESFYDYCIVSHCHVGRRHIIITISIHNRTNLEQVWWPTVRCVQSVHTSSSPCHPLPRQSSPPRRLCACMCVRLFACACVRACVRVPRHSPSLINLSLSAHAEDQSFAWHLL